MYPHFAYLSGNVVLDYPQVTLVNILRKHSDVFASSTNPINSETYSKLPLNLCINDGGGSADDEEWGKAAVEFMQRTFTEMSDAEKVY